MRRTLVYGATSAIAIETARLLAEDGDAFVLLGRNQSRLQSVASDLTVRGAARVETLSADLSLLDTQPGLFDRAVALLGGVDLLFVAYGELGAGGSSDSDLTTLERVLRTNFTSAAVLLEHAAGIFDRQGHGQIAVICSVAGDRGRKANYAYGAAKGALGLFLQGLRNRLAARNVGVLTIKPGFVDTPMTRHLRKGILFSSPGRVGKAIYRAIAARSDVVYVPWFWRYIMLVIKLIPEPIFKRLSI